MPGKSDLIREILAEYPDASAPEIVDIVQQRFGVTVAVGSVRAVKSRDNARGGTPSGNPSRTSYRHRTRLRVVREAETDEYDDDDKPAYVPEQSPVRAPRPVVQPVIVDEDQADEEFFALIDRVENAVRQATAGHMQQVTGDRELIQTIAEICDDPELRAANKPFAYEVMSLPNGSQTLRLYADKPAAVRLAKHDRKRKTEPGCEWCGNRQAVPGVSLYLVRGGALGNRPRILCQMHAEPEVRAGASATPYRVYSEIYGAAVIVPAETPMQRLRKQVMESAGSYFGMGQSLSEES